MRTLQIFSRLNKLLVCILLLPLCASLGDGVCETSSGNRVGTFRAAIEETNAKAGPDSISLTLNSVDSNFIASVEIQVTVESC